MGRVSRKDLENGTRPFLKWVGGKQSVLPQMRPLFPKEFGTYHEPFLGGGAVFFGLDPKTAVLADSNAELIACYTAIRDCVEEVIESLEDHVYDKEHYYRVRDIDPFSLEPARLAARMIYLNRTGFNGLYRVNKSGRFNVPFGRYSNPTICNRDLLRACSARLAVASLECASFERVLERAVAGDFVYFDPPYIPVSSTSYFTAYDRGGFGQAEQERLAEVFDELASRGVRAMLSNSDVPWIHDRYRSHRISVVHVARSVNSNTAKRGHVGEVVVTSY